MPLPTQQNIASALKPLAALFERTDRRFQTVDDLADTVIDPMTVFVHLAFTGKASQKEWFAFEKAKRMDKAFTNAIGSFHEKILSYVPGWYKPEGGFDLRSDKRKIVIEIKNKHNTMNAIAIDRTYARCEEFFKTNRKWTIYLAQIVPKEGRENKPWKVAGRTENKQIRIIDGATLYEIVTGEEDALGKVYGMLFRELQTMGKELSPSNRDWIRKLCDDCYPI